MDISKVDKNFEVKTNIQKEDIKFYNAEEKPFKVYGIFKEDGMYRRLPQKVAESVREGVNSLHTNTAGGRVKFVTDSDYVAIHAKMSSMSLMPHFAFTGSAGFDLYADGLYEKTFVPAISSKGGYESVVEFNNKAMREITICFPLYSNVEDLYIGIQENAHIEEAKPYKNEKPIVYYGSSITQGGCASRPGMAYQEILSRKFNYDYVNLGFSGNAKAEDEIIEYIKNLDMSVFVYDYDHNAPTVEHLENTHEKMFKAIREARPDIPIIIMPRPKHILSDVEKERHNIVEKTYKNAILSGDKNIYFISSKELTALCGNDGTVDSTHPTDFGFMSMALAVGKVFQKIGEI